MSLCTSYKMVSNPVDYMNACNLPSAPLFSLNRSYKVQDMAYQLPFSYLSMPNVPVLKGSWLMTIADLICLERELGILMVCCLNSHNQLGLINGL